MMKNIPVTGYVDYDGTLLAPQLMATGHSVAARDVMYYGSELTRQLRLNLIEIDIRDTERFQEACWGVDAVSQLACIPNDPPCGSVYGVPDAPEVAGEEPRRHKRPSSEVEASLTRPQTVLTSERRSGPRPTGRLCLPAAS